MESGLVIWTIYAQNHILKHGLVISTESEFNDTGDAYNARESIFKNCAVYRIDDVILL